MVPERERLLLQVHWNRIQSFDFSAHDLVALSLYIVIFITYINIFISVVQVAKALLFKDIRTFLPVPVQVPAPCDAIGDPKRTCP